MGMIYLAHDPVIDRKVAIKLILFVIGLLLVAGLLYFLFAR